MATLWSSHVMMATWNHIELIGPPGQIFVLWAFFLRILAFWFCVSMQVLHLCSVHPSLQWNCWFSISVLTCPPLQADITPFSSGRHELILLKAALKCYISWAAQCDFELCFALILLDMVDLCISRLSSKNKHKKLQLRASKAVYQTKPPKNCLIGLCSSFFFCPVSVRTGVHNFPFLCQSILCYSSIQSISLVPW